MSLRIDRLRGVLTWNLETNYHERLTDAHKHLRELNADLKVLDGAIRRLRQNATGRDPELHPRYEHQIDDLRTRTARAQQLLALLKPRQGQMLETVASNELKLRHERLEAQLNQARFAFADSYDRASKAQGQ